MISLIRVYNSILRKKIGNFIMKGRIAIDKFQFVLNKCPFKFSPDHVREIIQDSSKNARNEILYRELYLKIRVKKFIL